jgi:hypothetical protein
MTEENFDAHIAELEAQHGYLLSQLEAGSVANKLSILERLRDVRNRLHELGELHCSEIRAEREAKRKSRRDRAPLN